MSRREFAAIWGFAIGATALFIGWVALVLSWHLPSAFEYAMSVGVPIAMLIGGMWLVVRR